MDEKMYIPSYAELTVPELEMTSGVLRAASVFVGKYCDNQCKEFMLCKQESNMDPRPCLNEGKEVTRCAFDFFQKVKKNCYEDFTQYWKCVDKAHTMKLSMCRKPQVLFDKCMQEKMNMTRPEVGHFSKIRLHETTRQKPVMKPLELPDPIPDYRSGKTEPDNKNYPRYGFGG